MAITFSEGETKELNVVLQPIPVVPASLVGQVIDADTSLPIVGVAVTLGNHIAVGVVTGSDGQYSIGNIPPGAYTVRFSHPDYETVEY